MTTTTPPLTARSTEARLRPLYATGFIHGFALWYSIEKLFRAGASSVVSTIGYGVFIPAALGFGLLSRAHGIFEASVFVAGALAVMCVTLSVIVVRRQ